MRFPKTRKAARQQLEDILAPQEKAYETAELRLKEAAREIDVQCKTLLSAGTLGDFEVYPGVKKWPQVRRKIEDGRANSWDLCSDLIRAKVVVASPGLVDKAVSLLGDLRIKGSTSRKQWHSSTGRSRGYAATHFQLDLNPYAGLPPGCYEVGAELQVLTRLQYTWDELTHDPFYKPAEEGVPEEMRIRVLRLAAAIDLLDQETAYLQEALIDRRKYIRATLEAAHGKESGGWRGTDLDEVSVKAVSELQLKTKFDEVSALARKCGFRASAWEDRVRVGTETDTFLQICQDVGAETLGELADFLDKAETRTADLEAIAGSMLAKEGKKFSLFDRPLTVASLVMLLENPGSPARLRGPLIVEVRKVAAMADVDESSPGN